MTKGQRIVLWTVGILQILAVLFPPIRFRYNEIKYYFILDTYLDNFAGYNYFFEWSIITTLGTVAYLLLRKNEGD